MANVKISQLPEVSSIAPSDVLPTVATSTTSKITLANLANSITGVTSSISASYALTASYALNGGGGPPVDTSAFATTGSNSFDGTQTVNGNLFMSGAFRLVYNDDPTNNMLFGMFDGSSIHGAYYQIYGNQYSTLSQRGGAEFVYDVRNNPDANFHVASFDGSSWTQKFAVNDSGSQFTGSLSVTGSLEVKGFTVLQQVSESLNFVDDAAAAAGGVPLGGVYRSGNFIAIRLA